jgi:L-fuconolactonase
MTVDAHHHLWQPDRGYRWLDDPDLASIRRPFTPEHLCAELAAAGVARSVLVEGGRCHPDEVSEFLGYAADTEPIAGVVAWADLTDPELPATLAGYRRLPGGEFLVGVRSQVQGEADPDYLERSAVADARLVFDLVVRADQLPAATRAARATPQLDFVLDHLGKPRIAAGAPGLAGWRTDVTALAAGPNVSAKLSGLVTEAGPAWSVEQLRPYVAVAVTAFGAGRLMFGSDWPVCLLVADYRSVRDALKAALPPLTGAERDQIFGRTAVRVYGLDL